MVAVGCSKAIIITINIIFSIFGLAFLALGIIFKLAWDKSRDAFYNNNVGNEDIAHAGDAFTIGGIALGVFISLVAILGCIGACCNVRCMLLLYALLIFLLFIAQAAVVGYGASKTNDLTTKLESGLNATLKGYKETNDGPSSKAWSDIFYVGECCGVTDYSYDLRGFGKAVTLRNSAGISATSNIPIECCRGVEFDDKLTTKLFTDHKACLNTPTSKNAYTEGCYTKIQDWIHHYRNILIGVGIAIVLLELLLIGLAIFVYRSIDD